MAAKKIIPKHIIITGIPGVGKTTLMIKLQQALVKQGVHISGFITEEVRMNGERIGFDIVTVDGTKGQLARLSNSTDQLPGPRRREYRVGQYSVNLLSFEQIALPTLQPVATEGAANHKDLHLYLIDEIGKMELFSQNFEQSVRKLMSQLNVTIVATIPVPRGKPISFVEELRRGGSSLVFEVTRQNRGIILNDILTAVNASLDAKNSI